MKKLSITSFFLLFSTTFLSADLKIFPGPLVNITTDESVDSIVIVSGNDSGYMATWKNLSDAGIGGFSSNLGKTWTKNTLISPPRDIVNENLWVSSNSLGFLTTWVSISNDHGADAYTRFSPTMGNTWSRPNNLSDSTRVIPFSATTANQTGFLTVWCDSGSETAKAIFSSNGFDWGNIANLSNTENVLSPFLVSGSANGFMAVWQEYDEVEDKMIAYISHSQDGTSWNGPTEVSQITNLDGNNIISIASSDEGYLLVWIDESNTSYSIFSANNGTTWSSPSQISTDNTSNCSAPFVSITNSSAGFIASWRSSEGEALASLSRDNGATWETPVLLNHLGNRVTQHVPYTTVSVSSVGEGCLFTWLDTNQNAICCYAILSENAQPITNLYGKHLLNKFLNCEEYVNTLSWTPSPWSLAKTTLIFRNDILIATLPASQTSYQDHNQNKPVTYTLITIDESGNQSAPISISL